MKFIIFSCSIARKAVGFTYKLSPGGLRQFTLSPVRDDDRTQELGLTLLLGRVPMLALYPHTSLVYSYYHNIHIYSYVSTLAFYVLSCTMSLFKPALRPASTEVNMIYRHYRHPL